MHRYLLIAVALALTGCIQKQPSGPAGDLPVYATVQELHNFGQVLYLPTVNFPKDWAGTVQINGGMPWKVADDGNELAVEIEKYNGFKVGENVIRFNLHDSQGKRFNVGVANEYEFQITSPGNHAPHAGPGTVFGSIGGNPPVDRK